MRNVCVPCAFSLIRTMMPFSDQLPYVSLRSVREVSQGHYHISDIVYTYIMR